LFGFGSEDSRQQTADSRFWFSRQQTAAFFVFVLFGFDSADSRQQTTDNKQQTAGEHQPTGASQQ
jgi:hypothetical protein